MTALLPGLYVKIAAATGCSPKTARAYLAGRQVRPMTAIAIRRALTELGVPDPFPDPSPSTLVAQAISAVPRPM